MLNEYDGNAIDYELPEYKIEVYGQDYKSRVNKLFEQGYLEYGTVKDNLNFLTVTELKEILRTGGQKVSGKKDELVKRITENISVEKYVDRLPRIYKVSEKGRAELSKGLAYVENQKMQYGFLNSEIAAVEKRLETEGNLTPDEVLEDLFVDRIAKYGGTQNYGLLRNNYYNLAQYFKLRKRLDESLRSLLSVIYYDLSGMGNGNSLGDYQNLGWALETSVWKEIDTLRTALNLSDEGLMSLFDEALETSVKVPFAYFDTPILKKIILDRLHGETGLLQKYKGKSQRPLRDNAPIEYKEPPKRSCKKILVAASLLLCFGAGLFLVKDAMPTKKQETVVRAELTPEEKLNQEKQRMTVEGAKKIYQRDYAAKDTVTQSQEVKDTVPQSQDTLQNLFLRMTLNTTEEELLSYIAADNLEYTAQDTAPKQIGYKIGYRKGDTYHTRSTGGDYVAVDFDKKTGKFLRVTYFNSKTSTEILMSGAPMHGYKNDGRSTYYYFKDINNYKGFVDCVNADGALSRLHEKMAAL